VHDRKDRTYDGIDLVRLRRIDVSVADTVDAVGFDVRVNLAKVGELVTLEVLEDGLNAPKLPVVAVAGYDAVVSSEAGKRS
jgi:hypothetical protein